MCLGFYVRLTFINIFDHKICSKNDSEIPGRYKYKVLSKYENMPADRIFILFTLDMRWNNVGPGGGQKFCDLLQSNYNIVKLDLQGNHLGKDMTQSIGTTFCRVKTCI